MNTTQLCMQSAHQNSRHYVNTEGLICVLPYGAIACRMVHLHACSCFFMYTRSVVWVNLNGITCGLRFSPQNYLFWGFFSPVSNESPLGDWPHGSTSFTPSPLAFSFQISLPVWPQALTLVTLITLNIGKYAFNSLVWSSTEQWLTSSASVSTQKVNKDCGDISFLFEATRHGLPHMYSWKKQQNLRLTAYSKVSFQNYHRSQQ